MNRLDRALGILLWLRSGKEIAAAELARHFEVSQRTIYRDLEMLSSLGVPIYAERGRKGGFRLLAGYFLPPIMFTQDEALALVVGLTLLRSLGSKPFAATLDTAEKKLAAAVTDQLRSVLLEAQQRIGFEMPRSDIFHPERSLPQPPAQPGGPSARQPEEGRASQIVQLFLQSVFHRRTLALHYRSPYRPDDEHLIIEPLGAFWDRDYWYLVGQPAAQTSDARLWRADRVVELRPHSQAAQASADFDIHEYQGRTWLAAAMKGWMHEAPVKIRLTRHQYERLQQDWYYRHAQFEPLSESDVLMTFGEADPETVLELLRWLGPGAELLEPKAWRELLKAQLAQLLALYSSGEATP